MADGCGPKCAKMMLIIFNIVFWLSGCALIAVGIWIIVDPSIVKILDFVIEVSQDSLIKYAAYVLIAIGGFVFIVGFLGCCGAIKESKCMLGIYIFLLFVVMAGELAGGILAIIYKDKIQDKIGEEVMESLGKGNYTDRDTFWGLMDYVQSQFKCCGYNGKDDYTTLDFQTLYGQPYPYACCALNENMEPGTDIMMGDTKWNGASCPDADLHPEGCEQSIKDEIESKSLILIGIGIGIACLEIFGFIFAICLCRNTTKE